MSRSQMPSLLLGHVTKGKLVVDDQHFGFIADARTVYEEAIPNAMSLS
jgi:hypothetical protein